MQFYDNLTDKSPMFPFSALKVGQGFLVLDSDVMDAFHQALTMERERPGWKHGRKKGLYNSNVVFFRVA